MAVEGADKPDAITALISCLSAEAPGRGRRRPAGSVVADDLPSLSPSLPIPLTCTSQWHVSPMNGKPIDPLGIGSLQFLSRVAVQRSCHSCWETASSSAMDTRQAARVARAETRSKLSNNMTARCWRGRWRVFTLHTWRALDLELKKERKKKSSSLSFFFLR